MGNVDCNGQIVVLTSQKHFDAASLRKEGILQKEMHHAKYSVAVPYVLGNVDEALDSLCSGKVQKMELDSFDMETMKGDWTVIFAPISQAQLLTRELLKKPKAPVVPPQYNETYENRSVADKYIFFNTGMFNAITAMIPVALILWMAIVWVNKLQTPQRFEKKKDGQQFQIVPKHA